YGNSGEKLVKKKKNLDEMPEDLRRIFIKNTLIWLEIAHQRNKKITVRGHNCPNPVLNFYEANYPINVMDLRWIREIFLFTVCHHPRQSSAISRERKDGPISMVPVPTPEQANSLLASMLMFPKDHKCNLERGLEICITTPGKVTDFQCCTKTNENHNILQILDIYNDVYRKKNLMETNGRDLERCDKLIRQMRRECPSMDGKLPILIATDMVFRRLDVDDTKFVTNYDYLPPQSIIFI
ncbi:hypothetical protein HPG69_007058, partial [Diceros bicornis minor]